MLIMKLEMRLPLHSRPRTAICQVRLDLLFESIESFLAARYGLLEQIYEVDASLTKPKICVCLRT